MFRRTSTVTSLVLVALLAACAVSATAAEEGLDKAFAALETYDWGSDRAALQPIDDAVAASHDDAAARKALEEKLAAVLGTDASQAAKDYVCRELSLIGSAACVPAVAPLLTDEKLSHMARYALERIPEDAAVKAMRDALPKVEGRLKIGVINSLGVRRDAESTEALVELLESSDPAIADAAAAALGSIGSLEAAKALGTFQKENPDSLPAADAYLVCAEQLLADGKKVQAMMVYKTLAKSDHKHVKLAATRGLLAAAGKKE